MTQESNKFPTKTTIGAGILLLLFWHGKGFGFGSGGSGLRGEGKGPQPLKFTELGLIPDELQKMLLLITEPDGTRPADTIQLITVQRGSTFTGKDLAFGDWFRRGRLNLVIRDNGTILHGNMMLIQRKLSDAGIPAVYLTSVWNEKLKKWEWGQRGTDVDFRTMTS